MKVLKSLVTLTVALLMLFACSNPSITGGSEVMNDVVAAESGENIELVVGLKETGRPISEVTGEIENLINGAIISSSRGAQPQAVVSLKRVHEPNMTLAPGSRSAGQLFTDADYDSLTTGVERALYRDFQFTVHKDLAAKVMAMLAERAEVEFVQENYRYEPDYQPNDPVYLKGTLYGMKTTFTDKAWNITTGSPDIVVAVIDSGIEKTHPDLKDNIWQGPGGTWGYDFDANDNDPSPTSSDHGTHVAGTIGAVGNNGEGVIGVAPNVKLMAIKVFPSGSSTVLANAIRYAVDNGARVLNNSWGSKTRRPSDPTIEKAIEYAHAKGAVIIFSAGNNNDDANYYYAKNHPDTIVVAAVDKDNKKAGFSNYGSCVDIAAPGHYIFSTVRFGQYRMNSGTSMAAPHVSGLAALILSKNPHYTNEKVREVLKATATKVSSTQYIGAGVMNSYAALTYGGGGPVVDKIAPTTPTGLQAGITDISITLMWTESTDNVGVVGYKVYQDGVYKKTITGLVAHMDGLTPNSTYKFEVSAVDAAGNESPKAEYIAKTTGGSGDKEPPTVPTGLKASDIKESSLLLSWNSSTDNVALTGYKIYKDGVFTQNVDGPLPTSATVSGLKPGVSYRFSVSAVDTSGNESAKSVELKVFTKIGGDLKAPTQPVGLKLGKVTTSSVSFSWTASTDNVGVTGYKIYRDGVYSQTVKATEVTVSALNAKTTYIFMVTAIDAAGNESLKSAELRATTEGAVTGGAPEWKTGVSYKVGDKVSYKGVEYSCRMAHTSITGWTPVNVPALWSKL